LLTGASALLLSWASPAVCFAEEAAPPRVIRLPAITHTWKLPGEDDPNPKITIAELEKCMGRDISISDRVDGLKRQESALVVQRVALSPQIDALAEAADALAVEREKLDKTTQDLTERDKALGARRKALEAARTKSGSTLADRKRFNEQVADFNVSAGELRKLADAAKRSSDAYLAKADAYNQNRSELVAKVAGFDEQNASYNEAAKTFNQDLAAFSSRCTGRRTIEK
jgi:chromosome segregation ATPase